MLQNNHLQQCVLQFALALCLSWLGSLFDSDGRRLVRRALGHMWAPMKKAARRAPSAPVPVILQYFSPHLATEYLPCCLHRCRYDPRPDRPASTIILSSRKYLLCRFRPAANAIWRCCKCRCGHAVPTVHVRVRPGLANACSSPFWMRPGQSKYGYETF